MTLLTNNPKNQNLEKIKKSAWRYYHFTLLHHKWQSYDVWFLRYQVWQTEFFVILGYFFALLPPNYPENQNFEKMKKIPGDIIILHMSTLNQNHMMYDSWDMERDRQNFFSFWTIFCPFTPPPSLTTQRIKVLEKWKKDLGDIIILRKCTINDNHMINRSWDINCNRFFCHLEPFFALLPP